MLRVAKVETIKPPMTARASGADCPPPSPKPMAMGVMPQIMADAVMRMARRRPPAPSSVASKSGVPARLECSAKVAIMAIGIAGAAAIRRVASARHSRASGMLGESHQQDRIGDGDADGHDGAHETLH